MKKISLWLLILTFTVCAAFGQDAATQQQLDKLSGQIQDLIDAQGVLAKRMDAMEKEISDLRDKVNQPAVNNSASVDDLKKLSAQVQEIDKKRQADNDQIMKTLEKLAKVSGGSNRGHKDNPGLTTADTPATGAGGPQKGYDYTIAAGDTLSAVARAYRAQGVKVTTEQIMAANPGLDPKSLIVGKKIFIPDPNAK
jgi:LysM repeat protein